MAAMHPRNELGLSAAATQTQAMQTGGKHTPDKPRRTYLTPRQLRMLTALSAGPVTREQMDRIVGASNSPDEVFRARRKFNLDLLCVRHLGVDRDKHRVEFGIYSLSPTDRPKVTELLKEAAQ